MLSDISSQNENQLLIDDFKSWRKVVSDELQKPLYSVFPNKVLTAIVESKPTTIAQLQKLPGVGPITIAKYGSKIIEIVSKHCNHGNISISISNVPEAPILKKRSNSAKSKAMLERDQSVLKRLMKERISVSDLSDEQQKAAKRALSGANLFITGSAGTGKSYLLSYVIQELQERYGEDAVAITAPTGVAAVNVGGQTIHAFAGIGLGSGDSLKLFHRVLKNPSALKRWTATKVLLIDEISMLDIHLFETLDLIARRVKKSDIPFGGIQLIAVGDFLQLPPVSTMKSKDNMFCFQSSRWEAAGLQSQSGIVYLHKVIRQKDSTFTNLLNEIRVGDISDMSIAQLNNCLKTVKPAASDNILPTKLYCVNVDVDKENKEKLIALDGETYHFDAKDVWVGKKPGECPANKLAALTESADKVIAPSIPLKIGAQVMLLRNRHDKSLCNGSRGVVVAVIDTVGDGPVPFVDFGDGVRLAIGPVPYEIKSKDGEGVLMRNQIPLKLAWAMTVHKSQGSTLTRAELMISNTFDYGQAYVALSRLSSLSGLWLAKEISAKSIKVNPVALEFYKNILQK